MTDDAACRALMVDEGGAATTTAGLVAGFPACLDLVADRAAPSSSSDGRAQRGERTKLYASHRPMSDLLRGLADGTLVSGVFRARSGSNWHGAVAVGRGADERVVKIDGPERVNRALDGDHVAVEVLAAEAEEAEAAGAEEDDAPEGATLAADCARDDVSSRGQIFGRVVGVVKRERRRLCGSLDEATGDPGSSKAQNVLFVPVDRRFPKVRVGAGKG